MKKKKGQRVTTTATTKIEGDKQNINNKVDWEGIRMSVDEQEASDRSMSPLSHRTGAQHTHTHARILFIFIGLFCGLWMDVLTVSTH